MIDDLISREDMGVLGSSLEEIEKLVPSLFMVPNVAQYRALEAMYPGEGKRQPDWTSIEFANGVGKSHLMILDMVGWTLGPDYLCYQAFPPAAIEFYRGLSKLRDTGKLSLRLCCVSDDMKAGGSVLELLKQVFPLAQPTAADNAKCFRQIDVINPLTGIKNSISVKTFDQDEIKHSGSTCNRIWINEPIYENLYGETIGRIRSKDGQSDGTIAMFATILDQASYLNDLEDSTKFLLKRSKGHLYENCIGAEVTEEMAAEVLQEIGVVLEKNPAGKGYVTNGVLKKSKIDAMVDGWARTAPHQLQARKSGRPISAGGKIYPTYSSEVHDIEDDFFMKNAGKYPMVQLVDPHPARPDACAWAMIMPTRLVVVDEWPSVQDGFPFYEQITESRFTVDQKCEIWQRIEAERGYSRFIIDRIGDPNRFREPNPHNNQQLWFLYALKGFDFNLSVNDNLEFGHQIVNKFLFYDQLLMRLNPNDPVALPHLLICKKCVNTRRALANYKRKMSRNMAGQLTGTIEEKHKDFADLIRYLCVWFDQNPYATVADRQLGACEDYERVRAGRIPKEFRHGPEHSFNAHGRQVWAG